MTQFDKKSAERISRTVILTERQNLGRTPHGKRRKTGGVGGGGFCKVAKTRAGGVPARSGTTPGSGTVDEWKLNDGGTLEATGEEITAYNIASSAVAGNAYILVEQEHFSKEWFVIVEDCG